MADLTLDQALPVAQNLAERKANAFVRRSGFDIDDEEDVQSQLLISFLSRWQKFDGERASVRTFASRVMDNELVSILRYRLAGRRRHLLAGRSNREEADSEDRCPTTPRTFAERQNFWLDVDRALEGMPDVLLETAQALCWCTPSELSRALGRSRPTINKRVRRLREALLAAGIGPDYFTTSRRVQ